MELQLHIYLVEQQLGEYKALLDFIKMSFAHARLLKKKRTFVRRDCMDLSLVRRKKERL